MPSLFWGHILQGRVINIAAQYVDPATQQDIMHCDSGMQAAVIILLKPVYIFFQFFK